MTIATTAAPDAASLPRRAARTTARAVADGLMLHPRILQLTVGVRRWVAVTLGLGLIVTVTYVGQGVLTAQVLNRLLGGGDAASVVPQLGAISALVLLRALLRWLAELSAHATAANVKRILRGRLFERLLLMGPGQVQQSRTGALQSAIGEGVEAIEAYVGKYVPQAFVALVGPVVLLGYLTTLSPLIAAVLGVAVALVPASRRVTDRLLGARGHTHWQAYQAMDARFVDAMQGMTTLKAFDLSGQHRADLERETWRVYETTMSQLAVSMIGHGVIAFAQTGGAAAAVGIGAALAATGTLSTGELLVVLFLARECFRPFTELNEYWHLGYRGQTAAVGIFALIDTPATVHDGDATTTEHTLRRESATPPTIDFATVQFGYDGGRRPALRGLTLHVEAGTTMAIVGPSGSGKSTLVSLLLRFFDPQSGTVSMGGRDVRTVPVDELRRWIAVVWQDTYLFHGTVADNLRIARPEATDGELEAATRAASAHRFITALPDGYATVVGERGATLSGGERQRIAIARALLKDAPVLVLDEATSSVDAANEGEIREALTRLMRQRTTLIIAHRLSTIDGADRVAVVDGGRVVESGTLAELRSRDGAFARMVRAQEVQ